MTDETAPHLTEADIVRGLRNGDFAAWDALCDQFGKRIWGFLVRLVGDDEAACSDLFQETFLAASKSGLNLDAEGTRLWSWLARIAQNLAAEHWRRVFRDRRFTNPDAEADDTPERGGFGDPLEPLFQTETADAVQRVLSDMASDHVTVLVAKYMEGLSVAEIVADIGGTVEGVRSRLARAKRDFRARFERLHLSVG